MVSAAFAVALCIVCAEPPDGLEAGPAETVPSKPDPFKSQKLAAVPAMIEPAKKGGPLHPSATVGMYGKIRVDGREPPKGMPVVRAWIAIDENNCVAEYNWVDGKLHDVWITGFDMRKIPKDTNGELPGLYQYVGTKTYETKLTITEAGATTIIPVTRVIPHLERRTLPESEIPKPPDPVTEAKKREEGATFEKTKIKDAIARAKEELKQSSGFMLAARGATVTDGTSKRTEEQKIAELLDTEGAAVRPSGQYGQFNYRNGRPAGATIRDGKDRAAFVEDTRKALRVIQSVAEWEDTKPFTDEIREQYRNAHTVLGSDKWFELP